MNHRAEPKPPCADCGAPSRCGSYCLRCVARRRKNGTYQTPRTYTPTLDQVDALREVSRRPFSPRTHLPPLTDEDKARLDEVLAAREGRETSPRPRRTLPRAAITTPAAAFSADVDPPAAEQRAILARIEAARKGRRRG